MHKTMLTILVLVFGLHFSVFAEEDRNIAVDSKMGGMKKGSHIPAPKSKPGGKPDRHQPFPSPQTTVNKGTTAEERDSLKPSRETGSIGNDMTPDKTGELEDKRLFKADLEAEDIASVATEKTGETIPIGPAETTTETTTEVPTETSSGPIIDVGLGTNTEVAVDTSGQLEEKQILDADVKLENTSPVAAEVGSAVDITESTFVKEADITTEPAQAILATTTDVSTDVDTTGETIAAEADVGVEADVSGMSESEEVACDAADGLLPTASCQPPLLP